MKKFLFVIITVFISVVPVSARKEYKQLRTFIKNSNNFDQGMKIVEKLEKDSAVMNDPELYSLAAQLQIKRNDVENQKIYLKQQADTSALFLSTYNIFKYCMLMDEKEGIPDKKGRVKHESRGKIHTILKMYYPNLYNAGVFYIKKKNYSEAYRFFSMYLDAAQSPILRKENYRKKDKKLPRAAFWAMTCSYEQKDYQNVFRYDSIAMNDTVNIDLCYQYKAMSYAALKNYTGMERELMKGLRVIPKNLFFYSHLTDFYNSRKEYEKALHLCDSLIKSDPQQLMYQFGKSVELFYLKRYDECKTISKEIIAKDSTNADAYYYLASCYYNQATDIEATIDPNINSQTYKSGKKRAEKLFAQALPYMEQYRQMRPDDQARWAAPLYRISLSLNKGKLFDEMDKLLKASDVQAKASEPKEKAAADKSKNDSK